MTDFLDKLIADAERRITRGYYDVNVEVDHEHLSLMRAIKTSSHNAIIAEIKAKSPARGVLRVGLDPKEAAIQLASGGATALSVLTEPENFGGTIESLVQIRPVIGIPLLMKDVILDEQQIEAAKKSGADCVLLMLSALIRKGIQPTHLIDKAHSVQLEAILEVHDPEELKQASETNAEIIGINNRNLKDLAIDLNTTTRLLNSAPQLQGKTIISESGLETIEDIRRLKKTHVDGFLIGSSIMLARDLASKVREFAYA
jgi:indole-3-glycerol phosphate synthase